MDISWRWALVVVAGVFVLFLVAKMLPIGAGGGKPGPGLAKARVKLRDAKTPRDKAEALCDAADAALGQPFGATRAGAYFLRAMRVDPAWSGSVDRAVAALSHRRARLLEKMLWRRLAATPWDAAHASVSRALVTGLATVSKKAPSHAAQAQVMDRLLAGETLTAPKK
ncbi:MAG: hypothetical protein U0441_13670 [Polyangiaceae bacterium]